LPLAYALLSSRSIPNVIVAVTRVELVNCRKGVIIDS
jgi:hypothetical protein